MLPFIQSPKEKLFEFFIQINLDKTYDNLFPTDYDLKEPMLDKVYRYCFPFPAESNQLLAFEETRCVNYFKDPFSKNDTFYFIYLQYEYKNKKEKKNDELVVHCIVSKYLYPRCLFAILQDYQENSNSDILSFYYNAKLNKTQFDTMIDKKDKNIPIYDGLSDESQIAYLHQFFISAFPTDYIPLLITFLIYDKPILVFSSSFNTLTHTVLSIASFFYPLNIMRLKVFPLLPYDYIDSEGKDSLILGIPTALLKINLDKLEKDFILFNADEPYISNGAFEIPNEIFNEIDRLSQDLSHLCKYTRPAFPAPFALKRIQAFISTLAKFIIKQPQSSSYEEVLEVFNKTKIKDIEETNILINLLMNESESNEFVKSSYWDDASGDIIKFNDSSSLSIRRVPVPSRIKRSEADLKKKGKKGKK